MNYKKIYENIIEKAKNENRQKNNGTYYEEHHIVPKCLGGTNEEDNLILLSAREHFLCHWLLVKMYDKDIRLIYAFNSFCMKGVNTSKLYEYARQYYIMALKQNEVWKRKMANTMTKKIWLKKEDKSIRVFENELDKFIKMGYSLGRIINHRKPHSNEAIERMKKAKRGYKPSRTAIEKAKEVVKGKTYEQIFGEKKGKELRQKRKEENEKRKNK